jgi:hypothetical protein
MRRKHANILPVYTGALSKLFEFMETISFQKTVTSESYWVQKRKDIGLQSGFVFMHAEEIFFIQIIEFKLFCAIISIYS